MKPIAIDLGTTYSVIAIPEVRTGEGFLVSKKCPGCTVIKDASKRSITPSVVAEDAAGRIMVGYGAKSRAGLSPEPIMFAKRAMGEDTTFQLGRQGALRPEEVSAHVLRYLKTVAEERLGEKVTEAVITVPAYFAMRSKEMTARAGELAGLKVAQIALEPVAAALMYCAHDTRDPLRIMTYDLGGGTFDVAVLEKRDGVISSDSMLSFDGNRFLGGYNFDHKLAMWLAEQLCNKGYKLQLDLKNPADKVIFAKLMVLAERAKIALSDSETVEILDTTCGIVDHAGNIVTIEDLTITRDDFEGMIAADIESTFKLTRQALNAAYARKTNKQQPLPDSALKDFIGEIVLVGGSSRIPMVSRRIEELFGKKPQLFEPDLCVALGAALIAGGHGVRDGNLKLQPVPSSTELTTITVSGSIVPGSGLLDVSGCKVELKKADRSYATSRTTGKDGTFVFPSVPLEKNAESEFVLQATPKAGAPLKAYKFSVKQTDTPQAGISGIAIPNVLAKPIGILLKEGPWEIAKAGSPLPFKGTIMAERVDTTDKIVIPIIEGNETLGELRMEGIPATLRVGCPVEITLTINSTDYSIEARAFVKELNRDEKVVVRTAAPIARNEEQLRRDFELECDRADEKIAAIGPGAAMGSGAVLELRDLQKECEELLKAKPPDLPRIQVCVDQIRTVIGKIGGGWKPDPSRNAFNAQAGETEDLLRRALARKPLIKKDGYDLQLAAIKTEADTAFNNKDAGEWTRCAEQLLKLHDTLERLMRESDSDDPQPRPKVDSKLMLLAMSQELNKLRDRAERQKRLQEMAADFDAAADALRKIDPQAGNAASQILDWYSTKYESLRKRLEAPIKVDDGKLSAQKKDK